MLVGRGFYFNNNKMRCYIVTLLLIIIPLLIGNSKDLRHRFTLSTIEYKIEDTVANRILNASLEYTTIDTAIMLTAQAMLESNWGKSKMTRKLNNWFAVKGKGKMYTTWDIIDGKKVVWKQEFKYYKDIHECLKDRLRILRYRKDKGYATDPNYWYKVNYISDKLVILYIVKHLNRISYVEKIKRNSTGYIELIES